MGEFGFDPNGFSDLSITVRKSRVTNAVLRLKEGEGIEFPSGNKLMLSTVYRHILLKTKVKSARLT